MQINRHEWRERKFFFSWRVRIIIPSTGPRRCPTTLSSLLSLLISGPRDEPPHWTLPWHSPGSAGPGTIWGLAGDKGEGGVWVALRFVLFLGTAQLLFVAARELWNSRGTAKAAQDWRASEVKMRK